MIEDMIGKVPVKISGEEGDDVIVFEFSDGTMITFYHEQECCESVIVDDINGDWNDLIDKPILVADERISEEDGKWDHITWTFYTFRGLGGSVDVKWFGASSGYYSESVHINWGTWK